MLIPSIDLKGGAVVQLVQGERLAIRDDDVQKWVRRVGEISENQGIRPEPPQGDRRKPPPPRRDVRAATTRRVTAAGGITTQKEIDDLDAIGVDAVVGMAIYSGALNPDAPRAGARGLGD